MSYCRRNGTEFHTSECFKEMATCPKVEHVHVNSCFTSGNRKKCPWDTHTHGAGCVSKVGPLCGGT